MSAFAHPRLTDEQYLSLERNTDLRHEFFDGMMYAMSGGSATHAFIIANLACELGNALKMRDCRVALSHLRVRVKRGGLYAYPDVAVVRGEPEYFDGDTLTNPTLVIEVLSTSTESYDRGAKFDQYRQIPSLQEYALVSQSETRVELFRRQADGSWPLTLVSGINAVCVFESVQSSIPLSEIYDKVTF